MEKTAGHKSRKPRKTVFKQDSRLKMAFIDNKEYGRDIFGTVPEGEKGRWDLYLLFYHFCEKNALGYNDAGKSLVEELESRGYDISTIYFEIEKKNPPEKLLADEEYDCSASAAMSQGVTKKELRREFCQEVFDIIDAYRHDPILPPNWYMFKQHDERVAQRLLRDLLESIEQTLHRHFSHGMYDDNDLRKALKHAERVRIYKRMADRFGGMDQDEMERRYGFRITDVDKFLAWFEFYYDIQGKHSRPSIDALREACGDIDWEKAADFELFSDTH